MTIKNKESKLNNPNKGYNLFDCNNIIPTFEKTKERARKLNELKYKGDK